PRHQSSSESHADESAEQRKQYSFEKKLKQNAAVGGAQGFEQPDFSRTLADRDQHNVDYANGAQRERNQPHCTQKHVHGVENQADSLGVLNCVPAFKSVLIVIIKVMIAGYQLANFILRNQVLIGYARLIINEGNRVLMILALQRKKG